jgi:hypothetical protein
MVAELSAIHMGLADATANAANTIEGTTATYLDISGNVRSTVINRDQARRLVDSTKSTASTRGIIDGWDNAH